MRIIFGKPTRLNPVKHANDAENIWGDSWHAYHTGDEYLLEYLTGAMEGGENKIEISAEEFEALSLEPELIDKIIIAHGE